MGGHQELWQRYFDDFIRYKLRLNTGEGAISQEILKAFFGQLHQQEATIRMINLHVYIRVYQLDLAKMATVLRPLDKLQQMARATPPAISPLESSPSKHLIKIVHETHQPLGTPEHFSTFIIDTLFNALVGTTYGQKTFGELTAKMGIWFKAYR